MNFDSELFEKNLTEMNIPLSPGLLEALDRFAGLLTERNRSVNLTAVTDPRGIAVKHFADSLSLLCAADFDGSPSVIDIGTGAGFPGLPLLIAKPDIKLTFMDSIGKKLDFIADCLDELSLEGRIVNARAEDAARDDNLRESFDFAVSRAVADLSRLSEYALPFVKTGGAFIAMKGPGAGEEAEAAGTAIGILGGEIEQSIKINLTDGERNLILIRKVSPTSAEYPRGSAKIKKKPL